MCPVDNISLPEIEPRTFSFNSPHGACPNCNGLGSLRKVDPQLVFNPNLSIAEGGILPWARIVQTDSWLWRTLETVASDNHIPLNVPIGKLPPELLNIILFGDTSKLYAVRGPNRFGKTVTWDTTYEGEITNL